MSDLDCGSVHNAFIKLGIKPLKTKKLSIEEQARQLRRDNLEFYNSLLNDSRCHCCKPFKNSELGYFLKAYKIMSDEQILASYERENELESKEGIELLENYQEFKRKSRLAIILTK